jgi:transposase InsO family protein
LYAWKKKFETQGPAGLMDQSRGRPKGSRLPELTKRAILMLKQANPEWGCERISDMLLRGPALPASAGAVARVLHEAGYETEEVVIRPHPDHVRYFERARPNQLWQTDLFTFVLKRQNRRVYLVAFMDDHSRFIVGYGLHASQSTALVLEVLRAAITSYGTPARRAISPSERARFHLAVDRERFTERVEQRIALDEPLDHWDHSAIDRQAIPRALVEHGYLLFRRRRIPLRVRRRKVTGIS